jgi:hypothetical protein
VHQHFAAHFKFCGDSSVLHAQGNGLNGFDVGGDFIALDAIAPGGACHQRPVFIVQTQRNAIVLVLHDVSKRLAFEQLFHGFEPIFHLLATVSVLEAEHWPLVDKWRKILGDRAPYANGRGIRAHQAGVLRFQILEFAEQFVKLKIGDDWLCKDVIPMVVGIELVSELIDAGFDCLGRWG